MLGEMPRQPYSTITHTTTAMAHRALATYSHGNNFLPRSSYELGSMNSIQVMKDRKSTRLNSSHSQISYAVFCLKKKIQSYLLESCAAHVSPPVRTNSYR